MFFDGIVPLGVVFVSVNGEAELEVSDLAVGSHELTAAYLGDDDSNPSVSPEVEQLVFGASTTTVLGSAPNPSDHGQTVVISATVTSRVGGVSGRVWFWDSLRILGSAELEEGVAEYEYSALKVGQHKVWAIYTGDTTHNGSVSKTVVQRVVGNTATALSSGPNPSRFTQSVTLTATVTSSEGGHTLTGNVTFKEGGEALAMVELVNGRAEYATDKFSVGEHMLTAEYSGDEDDHGSVSQAVKQIGRAHV